MEGPTPVSALIHAATLVVAGVFLIIRCSSLFENTQTSLFIITIIGSFTSFIAASTGLFQNDLKRVIAYSTCSQLGYMIFIGSLALIGTPFLTGFYSKDCILELAFANHNFLGNFAYFLGCSAAFCTSFYSFRLFFFDIC